MPNYYPLMLDVRGRRAIVIGGDRVAAEKATALSASGAHVSVLSQEFCTELLALAEQKQLAAFSSHRPEERRRLVLQLLGITPLDAARDAARRDARETQGQHDKLRGMLPDLAELQVSAAPPARADRPSGRRRPRAAGPRNRA